MLIWPGDIEKRVEEIFSELRPIRRKEKRKVVRLPRKIKKYVKRRNSENCSERQNIFATGIRDHRRRTCPFNEAHRNEKDKSGEKVKPTKWKMVL